MNLVLLLALLGSLLLVAALFIGSALLGAPDLARRLGRELPQKNVPKSGWRTYLQRSERVIKPLGGLVPRSPGEMSRQERRLVKAGIRRKDGPVLFYGVKVLLAILILLGFIALRLMWANPILYVVLSIFFGALLPDIWLTRRIAARNDRIQVALPNALDLTVVCVEAGMGLDQALMRIGREMSRGFPELSDELNILSLEINAGRKRADALRNLGDRTNNKDLKALVAALVQTDRFGTSIAQSLRVFSESMRTTRRLRAEEHAAKMSVKMLPPLV
ncbi:MAG: type II secretion system F family protein, partial [Acidobacteriota bacterium]